MKKPDRNSLIKILSIAVVIQLVLIFLVNFFSTNRIKDMKADVALIKNLDEKTFKSLEIKDKIDSFSISKDGDKYFVNFKNNKYPGDTDLIKNYVTSLADMNSGVVVYKGKDNSSDKTYGFDEDNYQDITIKTNKNKEYKITIGNPGPDRGTSYIYFNKEKNIRLVKSDIASKTAHLFYEWGDRKLIQNKVENVKSIKIKSNIQDMVDDYEIIGSDKDGKITFSLNGGLAAGKVADELKIRGVVNALINLKSDSFKTEGGLDGKETVGEILVTYKDNTSSNLKIYKADPTDIGNYIVTADKSTVIYLFHEDTVKSAIKLKKDLAKE